MAGENTEMKTLAQVLGKTVRAILDYPGASWKEKREMLLEHLSDNDQAQLDEFITWFSDDSTDKG